MIRGNTTVFPFRIGMSKVRFTINESIQSFFITKPLKNPEPFEWTPNHLRKAEESKRRESRQLIFRESTNCSTVCSKFDCKQKARKCLRESSREVQLRKRRRTKKSSKTRVGNTVSQMANNRAEEDSVCSNERSRCNREENLRAAKRPQPVATRKTHGGKHVQG